MSLNLSTFKPYVSPDETRSNMGSSNSLRMDTFQAQGNSWTPPAPNLLKQNQSGTGLDTSTPQTTTENTLTDAVDTGKALAGSTIAAGQDIGAAIGAPIVQDGFNKIDKADQEGLSQILQLRQKASAGGQDTTHYDNLIKNYSTTNGQTVADIFPQLNKSNEQVFGDFVGLAVDALSGGALGGEGAVTGQLLTKEAETQGANLGTRLLKGAATGTAYGAGSGLAGGLQSNQGALGVAKSTLVGAGVGAVTGAATEGLVGKKPGKTLNLVQGTEDTMSKAERLQAQEEGRLTTTMTGGKKYLPSETETRASEILDGKLKNNPVNNVPIIKKEIATRGQEVQSFLTKNAKPISAEEQLSAFADKRASAEKTMTDSELKAYDEQVKMFSKQLPSRGGFNTANFYAAVKDYENNVADHLAKGKSALLDPTGAASAKLRAASDVRTVVRDLIGEKHPEFKPKMFDLASLYEAKSTMKTKADQLEGNVISRFGKKYPKITGAIGTGAAIAGDKVLKQTTGIGF